MADTNYIMRRTTARTWALVAVKGARQTLVDESKIVGRRRALIEFERKHRITVVEAVTDAT